jgi:hypothetical protein
MRDYAAYSGMHGQALDPNLYFRTTHLYALAPGSTRQEKDAN